MKTVAELVAVSGKAWKDATIAQDMLDHVLEALDKLPTGSTIGSGALIAKLLPSHTATDYSACVGLLQAVRKHVDAPEGTIWKYTGKKNRFGKPALVWLGQKDEF